MTDSPGRAVTTWLRSDRRRLDAVVAVLVPVVSLALLYLSPDRIDIGWPEWAAGVGASVLLWFRRRWPVPLLVVSLVATALHIGVFERPTPMVFTVLVLVATVCVRLDRRSAIGLGLSIAVSLYVLSLAGNDVALADARAVIGVAWTAGAVGIADAVRSWRSYRNAADAQVRSAILASEAQARQQVSEERLTIARELHDLLAHNLSVMNVQSGAALHLLRSDPDRAEEALVAARGAGRTVLDELSGLLSVLRHDPTASSPAAAADAAAEGETIPTAPLPSIVDLPALVDTMRSAGLAVTWTRSGTERPLAPAASLAAYRIAQEALTNAAKHGTGSAELVTDWNEREVRIAVANAAGGGSEPTGHGMGLVGMRERAVTNGGSLRVEAGDERYRVEANLPVITASNEGASR